jgi:hypothetical protein
MFRIRHGRVTSLASAMLRLIFGTPHSMRPSTDQSTYKGRKGDTIRSIDSIGNRVRLVITGWIGPFGPLTVLLSQ